MTDERWLPIEGFVGLYEVSDLGRVRSLDRTVERLNRWGGIMAERKRGRILKPGIRQGGHCSVQLCDGDKRRQVFVHVLVLEAFDRPCPEGLECRHLDGNPSNNRPGNLAWGTRLENMADRKRLGEENPPRGTRSHRAILDEQKVRYIRRQFANGRRKSDIARDLSVNRNVVRKVIVGQTWGWLK